MSKPIASAELNQAGQLTRQYIYLADMPIAVIDTPQGQALSKEELSAHVLLGLDAQNILKHLWRSLAGSDGNEQTAWLHTNHLGAPEAATDASGQLIWQASYAPFGAAKIIKASATVNGQGQGSNQFTLNLRLPGQYADAETGLHYNKQRYYDPARGEYLTPDPLGTPDGPNGYSYVRYNPLKYVDPDGLILFAFDGTDNTRDQAFLAAHDSSLSNVALFQNTYNDGGTNYVSGVGTDHRDNRYADIISANYSGVAGQVPDRGGNYSGPDRIARMMLYIRDESDTAKDDDAMQIDIVGFSRGAAQARDFANRITRASTPDANGVLWYKYKDIQGKDQRQKVCFRFMGLWDTVLSTNRSGTTYQLGIPAAFKYVAQAVALNEYRSQVTDGINPLPNFNFWDRTRTHLANDNHYGSFPLESIGGNSQQPGSTRVEMGFIGAHADIGGGYDANENGLSTVALSWMVAQAQIAGVKMFAPPAIDMNNPVIHDQSNAIRFGNPLTAQAGVRLANNDPLTPEDRRVNGAVGGATQRTMQFGAAQAGGDRSMTNADTHPFINYFGRDPSPQPRQNTNDIADIVNLRNRTGTVDMPAYLGWLRQHGYVLAGDAGAP